MEVIFALVEFNTNSPGFRKTELYTLESMILHIEDSNKDFNRNNFDEVISLFKKQYETFTVTKMIGMPYDSQ